MSEANTDAARASGRSPRGVRRVALDAFSLGRTRWGLAMLAVVVLCAVAGPWIAPHGLDDFVDVPNAGPSAAAWFGTDALGRDVMSRFLHGGWTVLSLSVAATVVGIALGTAIGLIAAYARNWLDEVLMRFNDAVLAFPQIVFALLIVSIFGPNAMLIVLAVGVTHAVRVARVMRAAGVEVVERDFVKAADAVGERRSRIIVSEMLPNVTGPLLVETGLRLTYSIGFVAALSFLGLGMQPPTADWGLMINENRLSIAAQPWTVVLPVAAIGVLTIGGNLVADGLSRAAAGLTRGSTR